MLTEYIYRHGVIPMFESVYQRRKTLRYWRRLERSQWWSVEELRSEQLNALQHLLQHANQHCPYYRNLWAEAGIKTSRIQDLSDFARLPLLEKQQIRDHRLQLRATRYPQPLMSKATGGSTGVPLTFDLDRRSLERRCAATFRGYNWAGAGPGSKQFYLWGVPLDAQPAWRVWKDRLYNVIQRRRVVSSFTLSEESAPAILDSLNRYRPDVIVAYTGALYQFARLLAELRLRPCSPRSLIVGAEKLHGFQRELIESVFAAPVFETYGSREFMLIGAECPKHSGLHLAAEQQYVEILDDDGRPTPPGEIGNVVVTDLYNYGMPFIRYVTGDQAVAGFEACGCGRGLPLLREVRGRRLDAIHTPDGRNVPGEFFPHLMKDYAGVRQFQVLQTSLDQLELRVVLAPAWTDADRRSVLHSVSRTVGPHVTVRWRAVPSIELTRAGKHRVVVSHVAS